MHDQITKFTLVELSLSSKVKDGYTHKLLKRRSEIEPRTPCAQGSERNTISLARLAIPRILLNIAAERCREIEQRHDTPRQEQTVESVLERRPIGCGHLRCHSRVRRVRQQLQDGCCIWRRHDSRTTTHRRLHPCTLLLLGGYTHVGDL